MDLTGNRSHCELGVPPPEITIISLNAGLTNDNVKAGSGFAYIFTEALVLDLQDFFRQQKAHGIFLCEMGSRMCTCTDHVHNACVFVCGFI